MRSHCVTIFSLFLISSIRVAEADVENSVDFLSPSPTIEINGERCYEALDRETVHITLKATRADPPNKRSGRNIRDIRFRGPNESYLIDSVRCFDNIPCILEYEMVADDTTALNYRAVILDHHGTRLDYKDLRHIVSEEKPLEFTCSICSHRKDGSLLIEATTKGYPSASVFILRDNDGNIIGNKTTAKNVFFNLSGWDDIDVNFTLTAINRLDKSVNLQIEIPKQPKPLTDSSRDSPLDTVEFIILAVALSVIFTILVAVAVFFCRHKRSTRPANGADEERLSLSDNCEPMTNPDTVEVDQPEPPPPSSKPTNSPHQQTSNPPSEKAQHLPVNLTVNNYNNIYCGHDGPRSEDDTVDDEGDNGGVINGKHAPKPRTETTLSSSLPSSDDTGSLETDNMTEQYPGEHPEHRMEELKSQAATNGNQTVIKVNETIESSDDGDDLEIDGIKTLSKPVQESGGPDKSSSTCINEDYQVKVPFDNENIDAREDSHDKVIT